MKKVLKYAFALLGWVLAVAGTYWGYNHSTMKEQSLRTQLATVKAVKQSPVSTFVDENGREHVKYPDGTVAKLPEDKLKQLSYTLLRDSIIKTPLKNDVVILSTSKVDTRTVGIVSKQVLDSLPTQDSIRLDQWVTLFPNREGGFFYQVDQTLSTARYIERHGLFKLRRTPYISFYSENPNSKITGYAKYDYPLPVVQPILKVYTEAEYDVLNKQPRTDIGASIRLGRFEVSGYGRLGYAQDRFSEVDKNTFLPSYGLKLRYNIIQL